MRIFSRLVSLAGFIALGSAVQLQSVPLDEMAALSAPIENKEEMDARLNTVEQLYEELQDYIDSEGGVENLKADDETLGDLVAQINAGLQAVVNGVDEGIIDSDEVWEVLDLDDLTITMELCAEFDISQQDLYSLSAAKGVTMDDIEDVQAMTGVDLDEEK